MRDSPCEGCLAATLHVECFSYVVVAREPQYVRVWCLGTGLAVSHVHLGFGGYFQKFMDIRAPFGNTPWCGAPVPPTPILTDRTGGTMKRIKDKPKPPGVREIMAARMAAPHKPTPAEVQAERLARQAARLAPPVAPSVAPPAAAKTVPWGENGPERRDGAVIRTRAAGPERHTYDQTGIVDPGGPTADRPERLPRGPRKGALKRIQTAICGDRGTLHVTPIEGTFAMPYRMVHRWVPWDDLYEGIVGPRDYLPPDRRGGDGGTIVRTGTVPVRLVRVEHEGTIVRSGSVAGPAVPVPAAIPAPVPVPVPARTRVAPRAGYADAVPVAMTGRKPR